MANKLSKSDVVAACIHGIELAQEKYLEWSGEWLWRAPEYYTTVSIVQEIDKQTGSKFITLENNAKSALDEAGAKGPGKLHSAIRGNGRVDILLWWKNGKPRAPLEVKRQVLKLRTIKSDLTRISEMINHRNKDSSLEFGAVAFYASCEKDSTFPAGKKLDQSLDNLRQDAEKLVGKKSGVEMIRGATHETGDGAWAAAVMLLTPLRD